MNCQRLTSAQSLYLVNQGTAQCKPLSLIAENLRGSAPSLDTCLSPHYARVAATRQRPAMIDALILAVLSNAAIKPEHENFYLLT